MSSIKLPKGRNLGQEFSSTISAQADILPSLIAARAGTQPLDTATNLANLNALIEGTPEQTYDTQEFTPAVYAGKNGQYKYGKTPRDFAGKINYTTPDLTAGGIGKKGLLTPESYNTVTHKIAAQKGISGGIVPELTTQALSDLTLGGNLNPADLRQVQQSVRSRQTGMLGGTGSSGDFQEALGVSQFASALRDKRRNFAAQVAALRAGAYPAAAAPGASGVLNPESPYAADLYNTNYNSKVGRNLGNTTMQNDLWGAGISAAGSMGGAALGFL